MSSKIKKIFKTLFFVFLSLNLFNHQLSFSKEKGLKKRTTKVPLLCPSTSHTLNFSWLKKIFQPCQAYKEDFKISNVCYNNDPLTVTLTGSLFLSTKGIELQFKKLKLTNVPYHWGSKIFIGFKIHDETQNQFFKMKEIREIPLKLKKNQFQGLPKSTMIIYGPKREGGQDQYDTLIENDLEDISERGIFRFYLTLSSDNRNDIFHLPGPILIDFPNKIKQRNTCQ